MECADAILQATRKITNGIKSIDGLKVMGTPQLSVVAFTTDPESAKGKKLNIYMISEGMTRRKWNLNTLQHPGAIHICCTYMHRDVADHFLGDLQEAVNTAYEHPEQLKGGKAAIYGLAEMIDSPDLMGNVALNYLDALYGV
eukprot:TRINITY_DN5692_c0_g1_i4.p1 TRINITY_DN5692_c0_g1~~TRINITY_DN5692_c0_g1_i4.p1  ORF type:complete len:142 (-),score=8.09 TRINITY_DN5692_c0_g1_i4:102-527(-)